MNDLVRYFWQLCLLRRTPADLPRSTWLLQVMLLINLLLNTALGLPLFGSLLITLMAAGLELLLSAGLLFAALQVRGHAARWAQSYTALLGAGVVLGLAALLLRGLATGLGQPGTELPDLLLFLWSTLVMAHILRHALEINMPLAYLIVIAYTMFVFGLIAPWVAPQAGAPGA